MCILHAYIKDRESACRHQNKEISPFSCQNFGISEKGAAVRPPLETT